MIVISVSNAPPKLRGFLTKYMWEISTGVYVGSVSARIRDAIWRRIGENIQQVGRAVMVYPADNEQGFDFDIIGSAWKPLDYEGLKLILHPVEGEIRKKEVEVDASSGWGRAENEYVLLDLETTGLSVSKDRILEIGAIRVADGECREEFDRLITVSVPMKIVNLTGITQEMADAGVKAKEALEELAEFIDGRVVVGYNIRMFDAKILRRECIQNGTKFPLKKIVDVMELARHTLNGPKSYNMQDVTEYLGIQTEHTAHRALPDCRVCNEIYKQIAGLR